MHPSPRLPGRPAPARRPPLPPRPLLDAVCRAQTASCGVDLDELRQLTWLRWLEHLGDTGGPPEPADVWIRATVRIEAARLRSGARRETAVPPARIARLARPPARLEQHRHGHRAGHALPDRPAADPEEHYLATERRRALRRLITRLPGRCPRLLTALLAADGATYQEIAGELGISQGSVGPLRSRCLGCLRRMLVTEVGIVERGGRVR
ncbi:RNA polymerase sigma factor [Streptomyces alkaliterrae]|uniref:Sigma-70 family RNA polymerase sigma factor n=1 Tax=Streptomyces alkaliterrae TaxID=2213162 RepID=A0A5P0YNI7_9ACTN|nr:sigma-70 family RNA polymerase sigma factor [Streptomyces alkaliterrae]MBB1262391.1 sigma-70 family RNA polymerase sigma factor [Streptomyces alkaliterrae]MQS01470.1 sigma-70 family RNA polymerase sigma factor [Streptomyces alkaliterrae]